MSAIIMLHLVEQVWDRGTLCYDCEYRARVSDFPDEVLYECEILEGRAGTPIDCPGYEGQYAEHLAEEAAFRREQDEG